LVGSGIGTVTVLSVAVLVLISFAGGIVARTAAGRRISHWSEKSFLGRFPHYQVIKSMAEGLAHIENTSGLKPALINIEGGWQIGYFIEQLGQDWVVVFLPQAPSPMSGNVMYMPADRVRPLDHCNGPGHVDRKGNGRRIWRGSSRRRSHVAEC
jgi:uncharacterized membrane protein